MIKRILAEAAIVAVQTAVLLGLAATVGVERGEHPIAAEEALIKQDQGGRHLHDGRCVLRGGERGSRVAVDPRKLVRRAPRPRAGLSPLKPTT